MAEQYLSEAFCLFQLNWNLAIWMALC